MRRLILLLLLATSAWAALNTNVIWEIRPTNGSDTNGGGFWQGSTGTDMTPFNNKNATSCTNCQSATVNISSVLLVTNATTTVTCSDCNFSSAIVGDVIYITGGTGSIAAARYQVITFTNSTTIVLDRSTGLTTGTGATVNIGGALQTIGTAGAIATASNAIFVKAESTIAPTANIAISSGATTPGNAIPFSRLQGYTSSRTDNGQVTIQASTNTGLTVVNVSVNGWQVKNFIIDCNSLGTCTALALSNYGVSWNNKIANFTTHGISTAGSVNNVIVQTEITGGTSCTDGIANTGGSITIMTSYIHANACHGISLATAQGNVVYGNVIASNSGSTSDGINSATYGLEAVNNTIDNNGRHGINIVTTGNAAIGTFIRNNMLTNNGQTSGTGYGLITSSSTNPADPRYDGNCYYHNKTGTRNSIDDTTSTRISAVGAYTNTLDVALSNDPYTNEAGGDLSLNNTASAGAACRGTGTPGSLPGYTGTGSMDFGALQSAPPVAAPTGFVQ